VGDYSQLAELPAPERMKKKPTQPQTIQSGKLQIINPSTLELQ